MELLFSFSVVILIVGALLWWRIDKLQQRIEEMDARLRQQIDSYGETVGEAVDYLDDLKNKEK